MKRNSLLKIAVILTLFIICSGFNYNIIQYSDHSNGNFVSVGNKETTREDAVRIILNRIIVPATLDHDVTAFLVKVPLKSGDVIKPFLDGKERIITRNTWFAFINDSPQAFYEHPTRFVYIDVLTGKYEVENQKWWPLLNGNDLFTSDAELRDMDLIIYSDVHVH